MRDLLTNDPAGLAIFGIMQKGRLKKWNDEKGFGFIQPENSDEDIFFHISAMPKSERRPLVGDRVHFNVVSDEYGRRKAVSVSIDGVKSVFVERSFGQRDTRHQQPKMRPNSPVRTAAGYKPNKTGHRLLANVVAITVLAAVIWSISNKTDLRSDRSLPVAEVIKQSNLNEPTIVSRFKCEGKTRCNQMTSCDEAMFYLKHCPGSLTDGDGDGLPCEDQWCGH